MDEIDRIVSTAMAEFARCEDPAALENSKAKYLGKAGALTEQLKALGKLDVKERPAAGVRINQAKASLEAALARQREVLAESDGVGEQAGRSDRQQRPELHQVVFHRCAGDRQLERRLHTPSALVHLRPVVLGVLGLVEHEARPSVRGMGVGVKP